MQHFNSTEIERRLTYDVCIPAIREAMITLSSAGAKQIPRNVLELSPGRLFGLMAGELNTQSYFGAKVVSVFHENFARKLPGHQGLVILFNPDDGAPLCSADASAITAIRTAAASAAATDTLARKDAKKLAILGYGEQAASHIRAISNVRNIEAISVWGRSKERAEHFAAEAEQALGITMRAHDNPADAVGDADIICSVTAASEPVLEGQWVQPGTHVNAVGSSLPGPAEIDTDLVLKGRYIADCRENVLRAGAEFIRAKNEGAVDDTHIVAEIGEVFLDSQKGRRSADDITIYKSLGHIVQDLAAVAALLKE